MKRLASLALLQEIEKGREGGHGWLRHSVLRATRRCTPARELSKGPVIGIAEAAMHAASVIAPSFSVVTTLKRTLQQWRGIWRNVYGMKTFLQERPRHRRSGSGPGYPPRLEGAFRSSSMSAAVPWRKTMRNPSSWAARAWRSSATRSRMRSVRRS